jgi:putative membrane protein
MTIIAILASSGWQDERGWDGPPWPIFILFALLVATLVVAVLAYRGSRRSSAGALVAERFARGEIEEDEYRRRLDALRGKSR